MTMLAPTTRDAGAVPVLMYHSISDQSTDRFRPYAVSPKLFAAHVDYLSQAGYTCLTVSQLRVLRGIGPITESRYVVMTFDDAYRDFVSNALPVLTAAGFGSTLFVPTGFVGGTSRWLVAEGEERRALLSWSELGEVAGQGVEIGAHSHTHAQLDLLDRRSLAHEISLSKALIEDHLQIPVASFAYPFGYASARVRKLVAALGFEGSCAVADLVSGREDDPFAIPRLTVTSDVTPHALAEMLVTPRTRTGELRSWSRARASHALRTARLKKRANAPGSAPGAPSAP